MSYNQINQKATATASNLPVEFEHPNTGAWVDGTPTTKAHEYEVTHLSVAAGDYGAGTSRPVRHRLKGSSPAVTGVAERLITVLNPPSGPVDSPSVTLSSIATAGPSGVNEGSSATYTVTGTYSDNSTRAIASADVSWGSNTPGGVLTVPANNTQGDGTTTTVTASYGGKTAPAKTVTITDTTTAPPQIPSFSQALMPGDNVDTLTWGANAGIKLLYNNPVQTSASSPGAYSMLVFYPAGTAIGQLDYDPLDEGHACAVQINSTVYYKNAANGQNLSFTNGSITLS